jgi:hypothetical protein
MIVIERGKKWFRPMRIKLDITLDSHTKALQVAEWLEEWGFKAESVSLQNALDQEEADTKAHKELGYICDPGERYKDGYLE